jgi:hypothetical protein
MYIGEPPDTTAKLIQFARTLMVEATLLVGDVVIARSFLYDRFRDDSYIGL